jgi:hypothetical protein
MVLALPEDQLEVAKGFHGWEGGPNPPPVQELKKFRMKFDKAPWKDVFAWYATESGLARVGDTVPTGAFTLLPRVQREGETLSPTFTLAEITDSINDALLAQKYILIRSEKTFSVVPADEKVDPKLVRRVSLEELDKCGRTELVDVEIKLLRLSIDEAAPAIQKAFGPFGCATVVDPKGTLCVRDTAANLRRIVSVLLDLDSRANAKPGDKK